MNKETGEDPFCEHCGIVLSLHVDGGKEPWDCEVAEQKVQLMNKFFRGFR